MKVHLRLILFLAVTTLAAGCGSPAATQPSVAANEAPPETGTTVTPPVPPPDPESGPVQSVAEIAGRWRLVHGTVGGRQFADATTGGFGIEIRPESVDYPINCNQATAQLAIDDGDFTLGDAEVTAIGCSEPSEESTLFVEAFQIVDRAVVESGELILAGNGAELRFIRPVVPTVLAELPLTSAGTELTFDVPEGWQRTSHYLIIGAPEHLGRGPWWVLTTATDETAATAARWGEADIELPSGSLGPGPITVVMPEDISVDDWALCSPFWEPDPYCFTLPVRLPSAPWFVAAGGVGGATLYNANGTSELVSSDLVAVAFYADDRLLWQHSEEPGEIAIGASGTDVLDNTGQLLDVRVIGERTLALVSDSTGTSIVDVDSAERRIIGPAAQSGRLTADVAILRIDAASVEAYSVETGALLWQRTVNPATMVNVFDQVVRLDTMRDLQSNAGPEPYFQYVDTELIELATGETLDSFEWEVAIPDEGHSIAESCTHSDFDGEYILCSQPDGRVVSLQVNGGDSRTLAYLSLMATYARKAQ
jgi:heat shock protein HslJ